MSRFRRRLIASSIEYPEPEPEANLTLSANSGTASAASGTRTFTVYNNGAVLKDSRCYVTYNGTPISSASYSSSTGKVTVNYGANTDTVNSRDGIVTVHFRDKSITYSLTQQKDSISIQQWKAWDKPTATWSCPIKSGTFSIVSGHGNDIVYNDSTNGWFNTEHTTNIKCNARLSITITFPSARLYNTYVSGNYVYSGISKTKTYTLDNNNCNYVDLFSIILNTANSSYDAYMSSCYNSICRSMFFKSNYLTNGYYLDPDDGYRSPFGTNIFGHMKYVDITNVAGTTQISKLRMICSAEKTGSGDVTFDNLSLTASISSDYRTLTWSLS